MKKFLLAGLLFISVFSNSQPHLLYGLNFQKLFIYDINSGTYSMPVDFSGSNGLSPCSSLIKANNGLLYGTTSAGGAYNFGVLFSFDPTTNIETVVHSFGSGNDGQNSMGKPIQAKDGMLYGMTDEGGKYSSGTIYRFNIATGMDTVLYNFQDYGEHEGFLTQDTLSGLFFGMTEDGGPDHDGTFFQFNSNTLNDTNLIPFDFSNPDKGFWPEGSVMQAHNGLIYGLITEGGLPTEYGILFSYNLTNNIDSILIRFDDTDGAFPWYSVMLEARSGLMYGMTLGGGNAFNTGNKLGYGVIFRFNPLTGQDSTLYKFDSIHGKNPYGSLIEDTVNGLFYGLTSAGGTHNEGVLFSFNPTTFVETVLVNFSDTNGSAPDGELLLLDGGSSKDGVKSLQPENPSLTIFPNPFTTSTTVFVNKQFMSLNIRYIELTDIMGRRVMFKEFTGNKYQISAADENLVPGMYFVRVFDQQYQSLGEDKIIVQ